MNVSCQLPYCSEKSKKKTFYTFNPESLFSGSCQSVEQRRLLMESSLPLAALTVTVGKMIL